MVKLKTFAAKPSIAQLEEEFSIWQTQNQQAEVVSVQIIPAGGAFSAPHWQLHVWARKKKYTTTRPEPPSVTVR